MIDGLRYWWSDKWVIDWVIDWVIEWVSESVSPLVLTFSSITKAAVTVNESFELSYQVTTHRILTTCSNVSDQNSVHIWTLMKLFITSRGTVMELDTVSAQSRTMFLFSFVDLLVTECFSPTDFWKIDCIRDLVELTFIGFIYSYL